MAYQFGQAAKNAQTQQQGQPKQPTMPRLMETPMSPVSPVASSPTPTPSSSYTFGAAARRGTMTEPVEQKPGLLKSIGNALISNEKAFAEDIVAAAPETVFGVDVAGKKMLRESQASGVAQQSRLVEQIKKARAEGRDTTRMVEALKLTGANIPSEFEMYPALEKSNKQVIGDVAGVAADVLTAGSGLGVAKTAATGVLKPAATQTFKKVVGEAAKQGLKEGAVAGAAQGVATGMQKDEDLAGIAKEAAIGTGVGAAGGAVLGGGLAAGGYGLKKGVQAIGSMAERKAAQEAEQAALLKAGTPDSRVATKTLSEGGQVMDDPIAQEAVRQGIEEADVALVKTGSSADRAKMAKMLKTRQAQLTNKRVTERATDVVGDTFSEKIAKPIQKLNREAGEKLNVVAQKLSGQKIDPSEPMKVFADALDGAGVQVDAKGKLVYVGSDYEGLKGVQTLFNNVWKRAQRIIATGDAFEAHRLKSYIDEMVNYGKQSEGLSGRAQGILKQLRRNIDGVLDSKFPTYNKVNTQYADTIEQLNQMGAAIGRTFRLGENFSDARAGLAMRRILSNTQSRSEILKMLEGMQEVLKKYGVKVDEDIITQANFADVLEKMLGTEAPTSLMGQVQRGTEEAVGAGAEIMRGNVVRGAIKAGKYVYDVTRGVNQENRIKALEKLLGAQADVGAKTPFGKPKGGAGKGGLGSPKGGSTTPVGKRSMRESDQNAVKAKDQQVKLPKHLVGYAKDVAASRGVKPGNIDDETFLFIDEWKNADDGMDDKLFINKPPSKNVIDRLSKYRPDKPLTLYRGIREGQIMGSKTGYESWSKKKSTAKGFGNKVISREFKPDEVLVDFDKLPKWTEDINGNVEKEVIVRSAPKDERGTATIGATLGSAAAGTAATGVGYAFGSKSFNVDNKRDPNKKTVFGVARGTNYDPLDAQQTKKNPDGKGAAGVLMTPKMIAVSRKGPNSSEPILPYGTIVEIDGKKYLVADIKDDRFHSDYEFDFAHPGSGRKPMKEYNKDFPFKVIEMGKGREDARNKASAFK